MFLSLVEGYDTSDDDRCTFGKSGLVIVNYWPKEIPGEREIDNYIRKGILVMNIHIQF